MTSAVADNLLQATVLSSPSMEAAVSRGEALAAAALCVSGSGRSCGMCRSCKKVLSRCHPDVIYVSREPDAKGGIRKEIVIDQIRKITDEAYILPNEAERKVFILREADRMNLNAQNAILKLLEEPPNGAIFLLCVTSPEKLLPTVRSRCGLINLNSPEERESGETMALAEEYFRLVSRGDRLGLAEWCYKNESMEGESLEALLTGIMELAADLAGKRAAGLPAESVVRLAELANRCLRYKKLNVGTKQLFGLLMVESIRN